MRFPSRPVAHLQTLAFSLLAAIAPLSAVSQEPAAGFTAAGHAWTYKDGTVFEALEKTQAAGGTLLEVFLMGQNLRPDLPGITLDENLPAVQLDALKAKMTSTGVRVVNAYIGSKQWARIQDDEKELRRFFDFGRKLGVTGFTGEPTEQQWGMLEKLLKEYDVTFAIHNHIKGFEAPYIGGEYKYWDPQYTFAQLESQKRDARFGICLDTGHVARSGLDSVAVLKAIGKRVKSVHLKDVVAADPDGHDCVYGTGIVDVPGFFNELRQIKFSGHLAVEYEYFRSPTFAADVTRCMAMIRAGKL